MRTATTQVSSYLLQTLCLFNFACLSTFPGNTSEAKRKLHSILRSKSNNDGYVNWPRELKLYIIPKLELYYSTKNKNDLDDSFNHVESDMY